MEFKDLIDNQKIPVLGLGTWQMGGRREADYSKDEECVNAIKEAIKLGYTLIDTAEIYGAGHSEELVGESIKDFDRNKLFIVTKVYSDNLKHDDLISSAKKSLKRLRTDYVDLFLIHAPNPDIPISETMRAMDYLVDNNIVKFIGVSNFSVDEIKEAKHHSKNKIVANQLQYSLMTREKSTYCENDRIESEVIPYCQENGIIIMADRPIDKGALLDKDCPLLDSLCKKYDKTRTQIALKWLISKKNMIALIKSTNTDHLKEDIDLFGWEIESEDLLKLDNIKFD